MKRIQLIETGILAVTLIFGYKLVDAVISTLITTLFQLYSSYGNSWSFVGKYIIFSAFYFIAFLLLIKYKKQLAAYIDKQSQSATENSVSETIGIRLEQTSLLFIVLVALCLATLLEQIPVIILSVYNYFKKEAGGGILSGDMDDIKFKTAAIKFVFSLIVLFYARKISGYFSKETAGQQPLAETTNEL